MNKFFVIALSLLALVGCTSQPHWQPIYDRYVHDLNQENINYNGKIEEIFIKIRDELVAKDEYATKDEIKMIEIIQHHLRNAIMAAKQDILNYPLENSFTKAYQRLELVKQRKITFYQSTQLAKHDEMETRRAQEVAAQQQAAFEQARWNAMTRNVGRGLGKTPAQIQMQQRSKIYNQTNCRPDYNGGFTCTSY
ncbi:hypothetical protein [Actinobacillus porcinus]|uniref:hypothetical protein n=1 Tax=Actinobacillus porcinus TaxID=51048 RepID=UPI0023F4ACFD|nr:hypothetical protein [Actinobacillus porcinus]MDD7544518.1 hypothetical protein [Actinobacillus porcinus]MDY5847897.1 hypothetical protein [Actinobacillus porcinus]